MRRAYADSHPIASLSSRRIGSGSRPAHILFVLLIALSPLTHGARLKDLADVQGVRENDLFGYGLVVGLSGTGDTERSLFTAQTMGAMLARLGVRLDARDVRSRNVAAVMVTARLPTFARPGVRLDVSVASLGDARSLEGGVLMVTPLSGADGSVYAVAQGPVQVGGFVAEAARSSVRRNLPTAGRVPRGAVVEKTVAPDLAAGPLILVLRRPDFTTASRLAAAVNAALGTSAARALDPAAVEVKIPEELKGDAVALLAAIEGVEVTADARARVVVSERTGTVVAGEQVRIRPVAVAHGGLQVTIASEPVISQPGPFARRGNTVRERIAAIGLNEDSRTAVALPATATVDDLVKALNLLGATPRDLISILQALRAAGALEAELEVL